MLVHCVACLLWSGIGRGDSRNTSFNPKVQSGDTYKVTCLNRYLNTAKGECSTLQRGVLDNSCQQALLTNRRVHPLFSIEGPGRPLPYRGKTMQTRRLVYRIL